MTEKKIILKLIFFIFVFICKFNLLVNAQSFVVKPVNPYFYQTMEKDLTTLIALYPELKIDVLGQSIDNRNIYSIHLGEGKTQVVINAAHHGREWITTILVMKMMEEYAKAYHNKSNFFGNNVKQVLDTVSITFIPMVNPDGVTISQSGLNQSQKSWFKKLWGNQAVPYSLWKANAEGIDPNRNYNQDWLEAQCNNCTYKPYAWGYKGNAPEIAPETKSVAEDLRLQQYAMSIAYHSAGEVIYWYYKQQGNIKIRDMQLAKELSKATSYPLENRGLCYSCGGGYNDFYLEQYKKPGFTLEVGKGEGKPVPVYEFPVIWNQNKTVGLWLAKKANNLHLDSNTYQSKLQVAILDKPIQLSLPPINYGNITYISLEKNLIDTLNIQTQISTDKKIIKLFNDKKSVTIDIGEGFIVADDNPVSYKPLTVLGKIMIPSWSLELLFDTQEMSTNVN